MSLQGEIQTMPLQDLLQWLELVHKTGTLTVEYGQARQKVFFRNGEITTASSSSYHSTDTEQSVKVIISETLQWEAGKFSFAEDYIPEEYASVNLHLSPLQLVMDTAREMDEAAEEARKAGQTPAKRVDIGRGFTAAENLRLAIIGQLLKGDFKVPLLPTEVNKILEITQRDNYSLRDLSEVIVTDQVITAQLLKHANSALYSRGHHIESVPMAVQHLGAQTVTNLVLTLSLQSLVTGRDIFLEDRKRIWKHSLACALLSRAVAPIARVEREQAFLCGLMIDFGKSVLMSLIQDLMQKQQEYRTTPKSVIEYLVETYHPKVGGVVGEKWKLPASVQEAITCHHALVADSKYIRYVAVASLCDAVLMELSHETNKESPVQVPLRTIEDWLCSPAAQMLSLNAELMQRILELVPECQAYAVQMAGEA
ncbi:MAG TPA: HDOD domain-containing protein [Blastocatellia bacterium]|nr:HDOD domain-containing protein [Blastocatellia bacterium]